MTKTTEPIQHPDGRWGVFVPNAFLAEIGERAVVSNQVHARFVIRNRTRGYCCPACARADASPSVELAIRHDKLVAFFRAHEFDPDRPFEALWYADRQGYGCFYLPRSAEHRGDP